MILLRASLRRSIVALVAALGCAFAGEARATEGIPAAMDPKNAEGLPAELEGVGISPTLGLELPKDVSLVDQDGKTVRFGEYFDGEKPVFMVFAYYSCPMLCTLVLNGALDAFKLLGKEIGRDYRVVAISFDERDTPEIAREKRTNYLRELGRALPAREWDFLTGKKEEVERLTKAAGFTYRWDESQSQYAHAAGLYALTPDGKISRVLFGVRFETADMRLAMTDATDGRVATLAERILLFCFHYEPKQGKYVLAAQRLMKVAGAVMVIGLMTVLAALRRSEKRSSPLAFAGSIERV